MSHNQSRGGKTEPVYREITDRSGNNLQQNHPGGELGGGGASATPPINRFCRKRNNAQGAQTRGTIPSVISNLSNQTVAQNIQNGSRLPPHPLHDSERWQRGTNFQKGLMPYPQMPQTPPPIIHRAENKYLVGKVTDEEQAKQRQLKGILNKLTPQNFERLFEQVKQVNIDNHVTLTGVISQIFDTLLMKPTFCEMYVNFCYHLAAELPDLSVGNEKITFRRLLLNKCQEEFERNERETEEANTVEEEGLVKQSEAEREEKRLQARRRMLGNIRLIGELYKKRMLTERIMHECIKKLLGGPGQIPDEEDIEALCKLLITIGEMIDHPKAKEHMDIYFDMMAKLSTNMNLSYRVRFMLLDTIDLRKNMWQQRRKVEQKRDQARHQVSGSSHHLPSSSISKQNFPKLDVGTERHSATVESHSTSKFKADAQARHIPPSTQFPKPSVQAPPTISVHISFQQQQQFPHHYRGPSPQITVPMHIHIGNPQPPIFVSHPMEPPPGLLHQGLVHQGLGFNSSPYMPPQMSHQPGNMGISMRPQFHQQQAGSSGFPHNVKITHPDTQEELKFDAPGSYPGGNTRANSHPLPQMSYSKVVKDPASKRGKKKLKDIIKRADAGGSDPMGNTRANSHPLPQRSDNKVAKDPASKGGKKKLKDIIKRANAAGATSDLYMACKGPAEKKEIITSLVSIEGISSESSESDS